MFLFKIKSEYISELFFQRRSRLLRWSFSEFVKTSEINGQGPPEDLVEVAGRMCVKFVRVHVRGLGSTRVNSFQNINF